MSTTLIFIAGILAIVLALLWRARINKSKKMDEDFQRRKKFKEELGENESLF